MDITPYLKLLRDKLGSDLFFTAGSPVKIKIEGQLSSVGKTLLNGELIRAAAMGIMSTPQFERFEETMESDFAISMEDNSARFRECVSSAWRGRHGPTPHSVQNSNHRGTRVTGDFKIIGDAQAWADSNGGGDGLGKIHHPRCDGERA
jgi:hypothetical protein